MNDAPLNLITAAGVAIDRENAWLLFASFAGDIERTALALNVPAVAILRVADDEGWLARLKPIIDLKKSGRPGDIERALNRAVNYVQVHKFRLIVERALQRLTNMDGSELDHYMLTKMGKEGREDCLTTRPLADLASALEKAHAMSYQALEDSTADRAKRKEVQSEVSAGDMYAKMAEAMSKIKGSKSPRHLLLDAQLAAAEEIAPKCMKPVPPVDDSHAEEG